MGVGKMDPAKRKLILSEIERWRRGRLLPEQYCDFLRNLYLEGEDDPAPKGWRRYKDRVSAVWKPPIGWWLFGGFAFILLLSLYFTIFHPLLQTLLSFVLVSLLIGIGLHKRQASPLAGFAALGGGCLLALLLGLVTIRQYDAATPGTTVALVAACGVIWIGAGVAARIALLQLCGHFALILSYVWLIQSWHAEPGFWLLQLYLLPAGVLLYAAGNWIYGGIGSAGAMLMIAAGIALLAPEIYLLAARGEGLVPSVPAILVKLGAAMWFVRRRRAASRGEMDWSHEFD